jgi:hypothetical protein
MAGCGSRWKEALKAKNPFSFRKRFKSFNFRLGTSRYPDVKRFQFEDIGGMSAGKNCSDANPLRRHWAWHENPRSLVLISRREGRQCAKPTNRLFWRLFNCLPSGQAGSVVNRHVDLEVRRDGHIPPVCGAVGPTLGGLLRGSQVTPRVGQR